MTVALLAYFSAMICVVSRGFLNVIDRSVFKKSANKNFTQIIFLNAFLPFLVGITITFTLYPQNTVKNYIFNIAVIINAFAAQAAATAFSNGFRNMTVRNLCASAKIADLLIPILIFSLTRKFSITEYAFSVISVAIFIPIFLHLNSGNKDFCLKSTLIILGILLFQSSINALIKTHTLTDTTMKFYSFMCGVLFWRVACVLPVVIIKNIPLQVDFGLKEVSILTLRGLLAFFSQSSFFFSITRISTASAWPILNSGPLISCVVAHFILKERLKKPELITMVLFFIVSSFYIFLNWGLLWLK